MDNRPRLFSNHLKTSRDWSNVHHPADQSVDHATAVRPTGNNGYILCVEYTNSHGSKTYRDVAVPLNSSENYKGLSAQPD